MRLDGCLEQPRQNSAIGHGQGRRLDSSHDFPYADSCGHEQFHFLPKFGLFMGDQIRDMELEFV